MSAAPVQFSLRVMLAAASQDPGDVIAKLSAGSETMRKQIELGLGMLALQVKKERFKGKGPFPVSENKLGVVTGRLFQELHSEPVTISGTRYKGRIGSSIEYFAAHELGFEGSVKVPAHKRKAYTTTRGYSVLEQSVREHSRTMKVAKRAPLATGIREHSMRILGGAVNRGVELILGAKGGLA